MEEINKKTLIESLSALPEHEPPDKVWAAIEAEMEAATDTPYTRQQLRELPEHEPPTGIWSAIEKRLDRAGQESGKIVPLLGRISLAVAASLALLLAAYWLLQDAGQAPDEFTISYSTEVADDQLLEHDWNEDEEAFEQFHQLCEAKKYICEHPEFQVLKTELDELTEAKESIQAAIGSYGTDPELVIQIKEIELERTDVLKKMMVMLI